MAGAGKEYSRDVPLLCTCELSFYGRYSVAQQASTPFRSVLKLPADAAPEVTNLEAANGVVTVTLAVDTTYDDELKPKAAEGDGLPHVKRRASLST